MELLDTHFVEHPDGSYVLVIVYVAASEVAAGEVVPGDDAADARFWSLSSLDAEGEEIEPGYRSIFADATEAMRESTSRE